MAVKVKFRFNKLTGEVEEFLVEQDQELLREQHDQAHEQIAGELGRLIDRFPRVVELTGTAAREVDALREREKGVEPEEESADEERATLPGERQRR